MKRIAFIGANNPETCRMMRAFKQRHPVDFVGFIDNDPAKRERYSVACQYLVDVRLWKNSIRQFALLIL